MKKIILSFLSLICLLGFSQDSNENNNENDYVKGISIKAGINKIDSSGEQSPFTSFGEFDTNMAFSRPFALGVDYRFSRLLSVGVLGSLNRWEEGKKIDEVILQPGSDEIDYFAVDLDLKLYFSELLFDADWLDLYLSGGGSYFDEQDNAIAPTGGIGGNLWFTHNFGMNVQGVAKFAGEKFTKSNHFQYFAGLTYRFSDNDMDNDGIKDKDDECPTVPGVPEFNGCPDSDGDGIKDSEDNCPNDAGTVENGGCPDRDSDGIIDKDDQCPDTPGLAELSGCPDKDGDGIADYLDNCPEAAGSTSMNGCPEPEGPESDPTTDSTTDPTDSSTGPEDTVSAPVEIGGYLTDAEGVGPIRFDFNQTYIKDKYKANLDKIIQLIRGTTAVYTLEGHTDSIGSYEYNNGLSIRRANAVKDYLVSNGLPAEMFNITGKGEYSPEEPNDTEENRSINRRVVIIRVK